MTAIVTAYLCKRHLQGALRLADAYNTGFCLWHDDTLIAKAVVADRNVTSFIETEHCMCCDSRHDMHEVWVQGNIDALAYAIVDNYVSFVVEHSKTRTYAIA